MEVYPPASPFMGEAWERLVISVTSALKVTLKERSPSDEVLATLLAEAEALVNSRPLTHVSADHEAPEALTPFSFILGSSSGSPSPGSVSDADLHGRQGWRRTVRLADFFWKRWLTEYLPTLAPRRGGGTEVKWKVGDPVIVADGNLPRGSWPRGLVDALYPRRDGVIRVAVVKTSAGVLKRPIKKLVKLPA